MNKKLLTAAITAGLMLPGLAAADIKMFGTIQAETGSIDLDTQGVAGQGSYQTSGRNAGADSGAIFGGGKNALGFKGTEKLGNGLSAYFKINHSFSTFDKGANSFGGRDAFVGLKGDGWHVQFGTMNTTYKASSAGYDPLLATGLQSRANGGVSGLHNGYGEELVEVGFKSGAWSGAFQVKMEDSAADSDAVASGAGLNDNADIGSWNGSIKYAANNWEVGLSHANYDFDNGTGVANGDADATKIHAKYNFGNGFMINGQYETIDANTAGAAVGTPVGSGNFNHGFFGAAEDYDAFQIVGTYALSDATTIGARYADSDVEDIGGVAGADADADHWAIFANHNMSKRTSVYGGYMANDYDVKGGADSDLDVWAIGLLHKF